MDENHIIPKNLELLSSQTEARIYGSKSIDNIIPLFSKSNQTNLNQYTEKLSKAKDQTSEHADNYKISEKYDRIAKDPHFNYKPVSEIPIQYQPIFKKFPFFNKVQSKVFDDVLYTDSPIVVSSPTGSGKTVVFELAIIRVLVQRPAADVSKLKVVYMAPMKVLCSERLNDWMEKFAPFNLKCIEVTGDTDVDDYSSIKDANFIFTTPEKWDSVTRKWKEHSSQMGSILLFLIDEVHMVGDSERGSCIEAVISRMKCIKEVTKSSLRFIAVSATIPNPEDFAAWFSSSCDDSVCFNLDDSYRPVPLQKVVVSYNDCNPSTAFKFDLNLNYKLHGIIQQYSSKLPTIVFCSTRKGTVQAASILQSQKRFVFNENERRFIRDSVGSIVDCKLRELLTSGVGYHHAGLSHADRKVVEDLFKGGYLPVICATSTLAMGVNLPAHLVIVKSTLHYAGGKFREYAPSDVLQMIGRAGRPQFDTSAVSVIMTQNSTRKLYTNLVNGTQVVESNFHLNLTDHLNAEIVLKTLTNINIATQWTMSLFLYVRIIKNPTRYGLAAHASKSQIKEFLYNSVMNGINCLKELGFILALPDGSISPTDTGSLMAKYCITFKTMKMFSEIKGNESLTDILNAVAAADEFSDIQLRVQEKSTLNLLNKNRNGPVVRFPFKDKIKTPVMKISILIQAILGCIQINDFALNQESVRIVQVATRLSRCLFELQSQLPSFHSYVSSLLLMKCLNCKLWENSKFLARQFKNVGPMLGNLLANAGIINLPKLIETDPQELQLITNKNPPFGSTLVDHALSLPQYDLFVQQTGELDKKKASLKVTIKPKFHKEPQFNSVTSLIIGTPENVLLFKQKLKDKIIFEDKLFQCEVNVYRTIEDQSVIFWLISHSFVGTDLKSKFCPKFNNDIPFIADSSVSTSNNPTVSNCPPKKVYNPYKQHINPYADKNHSQSMKISQKLVESSCIVISKNKKHEDVIKPSISTIENTLNPVNDQYVVNNDLPVMDWKIQAIIQPPPKPSDILPIPSIESGAIDSDRINQTKDVIKLQDVKPILKKNVSNTENSNSADVIVGNDYNDDCLDTLVQEMEDSGYFEEFEKQKSFDFGLEDLLGDSSDKIQMSKSSGTSNATIRTNNGHFYVEKLSNSVMDFHNDSYDKGADCKSLQSSKKSIINKNVIRIDENGEKFRECGHKCTDKKSCSHFCCRNGVKVKPTSKKESEIAKIDSIPMNMNNSNCTSRFGTQYNAPIIQISNSNLLRVSKVPRLIDQNAKLGSDKSQSDFNKAIVINESFSHSQYNQYHKIPIPNNFEKINHEIPSSSGNNNFSNQKLSESLVDTRNDYNPSHTNSKTLKRKYFQTFTNVNDCENIPANFEATQPPKFTTDVGFYAEAATTTKQASFSSIFDGIF